jgi:anti-sigma regulatory factor (Ser/Thr protein kinase)
VGGDWFDAMPLPDGKLGLVLGDVVGKGVSAAASMGQLRNALRAFSVDRLKPSSALARLNRLVDEALDTTFATIAYVVVDPATRVCRFASAGHPPPVLAFPDGRVELVEGGRGLPLGAGEAATYRQEAVELPAGTLLLLYSDGLVERRGHSIDEGLARLCDAVRDAPKDAERLLEHVLDTMVGSEERDDDIALLAARLLVVAPQPLDLRVQRRVESLDLVRDAVRVWLDGTPLGRTEAEDVMLATWEAFANAIEHALDPTGDTVQIRACVDGTTIRVVVEDTGRWAPASDRPDRGLGLRLIESTMSSVDVETSDGGTRITIEKRPAGAAN